MIEVEIVRQTNTLIEHYEQCFERKYKTKPHMDQADRTVIKDIVRVQGFELGKSLVEAYFRSQNEWFKKKAHSLVVLKSNINVVLSELGPRQESQRQGNAGLRIMIEAYCFNEKCGNRFDVVCNSNDVHRETWNHLCPQCEEVPI